MIRRTTIAQRLRRGTIAQRLRWYLISGTILILILVTVSSYLDSRALLSQQNRERIDFLASSTASHIESVFSNIENVTEGMARQLELDPPSTPEEIRQMLELCLRSHDYINGSCIAYSRDRTTSMPVESMAAPFLFRGEADGELAYEDLGKKRYSYETQDWYVLPHEMLRPVWSEPYADIDSNYTLIVTYSVPFFRREGEQRIFEGVVTADLSLKWMGGLLKSLPLDSDDYAFLITRHGTYMAHPDSNLVMNETIFSVAESTRNPMLRELGRAMVRGQQGVVDYVSLHRRQPSWLAYSPIPSTHWSVGVVVPRAEMNRRLNRLATMQILVGLIGTLMLLLVIRLVAQSITRPLNDLRAKARVLATGNLDAPVAVLGGDQDEVAALGSAFEKMRLDLKSYMEQLGQTVSRKERIESELRIAHDIQMSLVPKTFPAFPERQDMDLHATMVPAFDVGGDFYDFFLIDDHRLFLAIGDVSGKGVAAALFMAVTRSFLRSKFQGEISLSAGMALINDELAHENDSCMFVTLFCAIADLKTGRVDYLNAGHNFPFLVNSQGEISELEEQAGPPLGIMEGTEYGAAQVQLRPGDLLYLFTDGVNEAMNSGVELFGNERIRAYLAECRDDPCATVSQQMQLAIHEFVGGAEQSDDITMLIWRWYGAGAEAAQPGGLNSGLQTTGWDG